MPTPARPAPNPFVKLAIELGPLVVFFVVNRMRGAGGEEVDADQLALDATLRATAAFMLVMPVSLVASWRLERRLPIMPLVTTVFVLIFGALTLWFGDATFIKVKPTLINLLFAATLFIGLAFGRNLLEVLLGTALHLQDEGWRILTRRWAFFFLFLAGVNEIVWRSFSTDFWAGFKLFGIMPITILFTLTQVPLLTRYQVETESETGEGQPAEAPATPERAQDPS